MKDRSMTSPPDSDLPLLQTEEFLPPIDHWMTLGALALSGSVVGLVAIAALTRYNVTVEAMATVRPVGDLSVVQAGVEGTVSQVRVQETQVVRQGDVLAEIEVSDRAQLRRLQARKTVLQGYLRQYNDQLASVNGQLQAINRQILLESELPPPPIATVQTGKPSIPDGFITIALDTLAQRVPRRATSLSSQRDRLLQQRVGLQNQIRYDQENLAAVNTEINKQVLRAPADGAVLKLEVQSGQPIRVGEEIAQIVPQNTALIAKAQVAAQNISQVSIGQPVQLRVTAYPYPDYGVLSATVQAIAPDVTTIRDPNGSMLSFYEVTIKPDRPYLVREDQQYPLQPGMEARADIISRQETLLQFCLRKARLWTGV